jgi:hypothetical protein
MVLQPCFHGFPRCERRVRPGSGLNSESVDAVSGCLDTTLSAGPGFGTHRRCRSALSNPGPEQFRTQKENPKRPESDP